MKLQLNARNVIHIEHFESDTTRCYFCKNEKDHGAKLHRETIERWMVEAEVERIQKEKEQRLLEIEKRKAAAVKEQGSWCSATPSNRHAPNPIRPGYCTACTQSICNHRYTPAGTSAYKCNLCNETASTYSLVSKHSAKASSCPHTHFHQLPARRDLRGIVISKRRCNACYTELDPA